MDCPECGGALAAYVLEGREAAVCERCGWVGIEAEHRGEPRPAESWGDALDRFYDRHAETERRTADLPTVAAAGGPAGERETDADETDEADDEYEADDERETDADEADETDDERETDEHEADDERETDERETDDDERETDGDGADLDDVEVTALVEDAVAEADGSVVRGLIEEAEPDGRTDEDDADGTTD
jgi:hypothetical protein